MTIIIFENNQYWEKNNLISCVVNIKLQKKKPRNVLHSLIDRLDLTSYI